jgi:hypothetical protein
MNETRPGASNGQFVNDLRNNNQQPQPNMKTKWTALTPALLLALGLHAADTVKYDAQPIGSKMRIEGTSSIHDWNAESGIIKGAFEADAAWQKDPSLKTVTTLGTGKAPDCKISIPVRSLRSSSGTAMDGIMMQAMKGTEHKEIVFKLTEMVKKGDVPASGAAEFDCKGDLTVSGQTKPVSFPIKMERAEGDKLKFTGTTKVKMTDFGIQPPSPSIGGVSIKTGDDVTLIWTWCVGIKKD